MAIPGRSYLVSENQNSHKAVVLSAGTLPELLGLREEILRSAGFEVFTVTRREEALAAVKRGDCGVLLLCYSVPNEWRGELIRKFRQACPKGRVIGITNYPVVRPAKETDALIYGIEGAEALISAVRRESAA